jgi:uncharacterized protein
VCAVVIDVHVHIFEEKMWPRRFLEEIRQVKRRTLTEEEFRRYIIDMEATPSALIRDMDEAGVDVSVCSPVDYAFLCQEEPEIPIWRANEYVAEAQQKYPGRIVGFAGVDPMRPGAVEFIEKAVRELGLKGVKLFPGWYFPNDERIAPFISKIEELGLPVLFHQGSDPHPFVMKYGDPRYVDDVLLKHPRLRVIEAHCGRGFDDLLVEMAIWRPNRIWVDLAGLQHEYRMSPWHFLMRLRYLVDRVADAVVVGSDWPFVKTPPNPTHAGWVRLLKELELPGACLDMGMKQFTKGEKEKLLGENARKLLNL